MSIKVAVPLPTQVGEEPLLRNFKVMKMKYSSTIYPLELESYETHRAMSIGIHTNEDDCIPPTCRPKKNTTFGN